MITEKDNYKVVLGVTAIIHRDQDDAILLGKKSRGLDTVIGKWVTPGGRVEFGETLEQAIIREVKEETAMDFRITGVLSPRQYILGQHHFVFVVYEGIGSGVVMPGGDLSHAAFFSLHEVWNMITDKKITEISTGALFSADLR